MTKPTSHRQPLSSAIPPLILGTATFNTQYVADPSRLPYVEIVSRALDRGVTAFDTSPYYGPSETLLGAALAAVDPAPPRDSYFLVTKAGRIAAAEFDYSPAWIRYSVGRSLERLGTPYLDLVYAHDVEFVSPAEVLAAVGELRRLRDRGLVRYVGISGYPVSKLCSLAELILKETGEPLDAVLSYSHFCVQNSVLGKEDTLARLRNAGVDVVLNASMLSMGLLTTRGADRGPMATWHPAPSELQVACRRLSHIAEARGETLEGVAIRWALQSWARLGSDSGFGTTATSRPGLESVGVSVMGVSSVAELEETSKLWGDVLEDLAKKDAASGCGRSKGIQSIVEEMWLALGTWRDYSWQSPGPDFVNQKDSQKSKREGVGISMERASI